MSRHPEGVTESSLLTIVIVGIIPSVALVILAGRACDVPNPGEYGEITEIQP